MCLSLFFEHATPEVPLGGGMRWKVSLLAAEGFLAGATGWSCNPLVVSPACGGDSTFKRPRARHQEQKKQQLAQQQQHQGQVVEFKGFRRRRRLLHTTMTAAAGGGSGDRGDCPSKNYNKDAWQRRASRAMKYVSMPIVKMAGQPREQVKISLFLESRDSQHSDACFFPRCAALFRVGREAQRWREESGVTQHAVQAVTASKGGAASFIEEKAPEYTWIVSVAVARNIGGLRVSVSVVTCLSLLTLFCVQKLREVV